MWERRNINKTGKMVTIEARCRGFVLCHFG